MDKPCTYCFGYGPASGIEKALGSVFFGTSLGQAQSLSMPRGIPGQRVGEACMDRLWANGTADMGNVTTYMDGITAWIMTTIRQEAVAHDDSYGLGTVLRGQTCVAVNWPWIFFPTALSLLTLLFSTLTVSRLNHCAGLDPAHQGRRKPWKSSTLPLLWSGLDYSIRDRHPCLNDVPGMEACSEKTMVRLAKAAESPAPTHHATA